MQRYQVLERSLTHSLQAPITYTYAHSHIKAKSQKWTLKFVTETYALTKVKPFQFLSNFTNHPLFIYHIGCQWRKPQTKAERKNAFRGTVPRAGFGEGWVARPAARARWFVFFAVQTQKRGFSSQYPKSDHNNVYTTSLHLQLHLITSIYTKTTRLMTFDHQTLK